MKSHLEPPEGYTDGDNHTEEGSHPEIIQLTCHVTMLENIRYDESYCNHKYHEYKDKKPAQRDIHHCLIWKCLVKVYGYPLIRMALSSK